MKPKHPTPVPKTTNQEKLERAKQYLGKKWVLHPQYEFQPQHQPQSRK